MKRKSLVLLVVIFIMGCDKETNPVYRDYMRTFVSDISTYAKSNHEDFIIIPQNGHELVSIGGEGKDDPQMDYLNSIDGAGQEDLYFGYDEDDVATNSDDTGYLLKFLKLCESNGVEVLVSDYCSSSEHVSTSYSENNKNNFISFAAEERELNIIPSGNIFNENADDVGELSEAKNFLYLINPEKYSSKETFLNALINTNYDLLIIDFFFGNEELTANDVALLKIKANGGSRLVISYLSIGEAEDYRYYWQSEWEDDPPDWLEKENRKWKGNYKVKYWDDDWQSIIYGNEDAYLDKIIESGFNGVYLDIIEAFEYFE